MVFQLVRNTTAIWRNAARYCWFKMDLFHFKAVQKTASSLHPCLLHPEGHLGVLVTQ